MHRKVWVFMVFVFLMSCIHFRKKDFRSNWEVLKESTDLVCALLPIRSQDLRIDKVHLISGIVPSLFLEALDRRGERIFYHLAFPSIKKLSTSQLQPLTIGREASFVGSILIEDKVFFVIKTKEHGQDVIQVRDLLDNQLLQQYPVDSSQKWEVADWAFKIKTLRALVREEVVGESIDDQPYLKFELSLDTKKGKITLDSDKRIIGEAKLITDTDGESHILWLDKGTSKNIQTNHKFLVSPWKSEKSIWSLNLPISVGVESWDYLDLVKTAYIVSVSGDTLLWNSAMLNIQGLDKSRNFFASHAFSLPLSKVHVANPYLAKNHRNQLLFVPQWLDYESSLAVYNTSENKLDLIGYFGIFPEGTSFHEVFYHEVSDKYLVLSKGSAKNQGKISLCEIDL